jgi:GDP/UDP-N,N'-diacetylbacillosamine 2-epimerase (hydrolysing)
MRKNICFLSGKRGGFGQLVPIIEAVETSHDLDYSLIVTDMHLSPRFGYTVAEVERWFGVSWRVDMLLQGDSPVIRAKSLGIGLYGMSQAIENIRPDIVFIAGDRGEALMMAVAAVNMNIPVAHIFGGDVSGGVDEPVRHAITKLSHIHFTTNELSAQRVRRLGEEDWRIHVVGAPILDMILQKRFSDERSIIDRYPITKDRPFLIVLQHPVTWEVEEAFGQIEETMAAIEELMLPTIVVYPCSDPGHESVIRAIEEYTHLPFVQIYPNIPFDDFLGLLSLAGVMVGNSSSGLYEAPSFHLPVVNIGSRQAGRLKAENVIDVPHDKNAIVDAIKKGLYDPAFRHLVSKCNNPYGNGNAAEQIIRVLRDVDLTPRLLRKKIAYQF